MNRAAGPGQQPPAGADPAVDDDRPALVQDSSLPGGDPTLVDDLLNYEHPLL
jgi:hypothetical protein